MHQGQGARLQWHPPQSSPETHLTACTGGEDDFPGPPSGGDGSVKTLGGILNKETEAQNGFGFAVLGSRTQNSKKSVPFSTEHTFCSFLLNIRLRSEKKEDTDLNYIADSQSSFCASFDSSHGAVASCLSQACLPISPLPLETVSSCISPHLAQKNSFSDYHRYNGHTNEGFPTGNIYILFWSSFLQHGYDPLILEPRGSMKTGTRREALIGTQVWIWVSLKKN